MDGSVLSNVYQISRLRSSWTTGHSASGGSLATPQAWQGEGGVGVS